MNRADHFTEYFRHRQILPSSYDDYQLPPYILSVLPTETDSPILDFGCGFGQTVRALRQLGYVNAVGYDISPEASAYCRANDIPLLGPGPLEGRLLSHKGEFKFIILNHVLEHIPKSQTIETLKNVRQMLSVDGVLFLAVPNAQASTGCYWAYEDFTHETLFTAGSAYYVLSKAGFSEIQFIDRDCTEGLPILKRAFRKALLNIYRKRYLFWNYVTGSALHQPSPNIFSYEIKAIARP